MWGSNRGCSLCISTHTGTDSLWETEALQASAAGSCLNADEGLSPFLLTLTLHLPGKDVGVIVVHLLSGGVRLSIMDVFDLCWQTRTYDRPAGPKDFQHKTLKEVSNTRKPGR